MWVEIGSTVALLGLDSVISMVSSFSSRASLTTAMLMFLLVTPGAKVSVPPGKV